MFRKWSPPSDDYIEFDKNTQTNLEFSNISKVDGVDKLVFGGVTDEYTRVERR